MTSTNIKINSSISVSRTFWRTIALIMLFNISLLIFRQLIQGHSLFVFIDSGASNNSEHSLSNGLLLDLLFFFSPVTDPSYVMGDNYHHILSTLDSLFC